MDWLLNWDVGRVLNAVLSSAVVIVMTMGYVYHRTEMPKKVRHIAPWVIGTYAIIAYGSASLAAEPGHIPAGYRVGLMMLNLTGLLIVLVWHIEDGYGFPEKKSPTMKSNDSV
jgi:hypothetical protein